MPVIGTKGAMSSQGFGEFTQASGPANYIEDVFSTWLYTGNGSTQTMANGIDLTGKGGMVWIKSRSSTGVNPTSSAYDINNHYLFDTVRTNQNALCSSSSAPQDNSWGSSFFNFLSNGFNAGTSANNYSNQSGNNYASWSFRKQPKFFDVVTTSSATVSHSLGSIAGFVIWKRTNVAEDWNVLARASDGSYYQLNLNLTDGAFASYANAAAAGITSTNITLASFTTGGTYVVYLYAHNAGGFGLSGSDNVITCSSMTTSSLTGKATVSLGYEPQFVITKATSTTSNWITNDNMRGMPTTDSSTAQLYPNLTNAEATGTTGVTINSTGFSFNSGIGGTAHTYIYIAIRRGPMKVPTDATKVFAPITSSVADGTQITSGFPVDMQMFRYRSGTVNTFVVDRLRGVGTTPTVVLTPQVRTNLTDAETNTGGIARNWNNTGFAMPSGFGTVNDVFWNFQRAPSFFDDVCYTGTGSLGNTLTHNLGVTPELMIVKCRSNNPTNWTVYTTTTGNTAALYLNATDSVYTGDINYWNNTSPTSTQFTVGLYGTVNGSARTYVAYLFATCAGVSKVGSYTGNGSSQTINCGFTGGARFVMVKATSTTGNWIVADSARGIVSGNDPALYLNSTAAEVTTLDWIDADNSGFVVNETATIAANTNGVSYIYLAIA